MSEMDPIELLRTLRPEDEGEEEARRATEEILTHLVEEGLVDPAKPASSRRQRANWRTPWFRVATVAAVIAAVVLAAATLALTPAGTALANWIGEVIGIGKPGGVPSLEGNPRPERRDPAAPAIGSGIVPPTVLATGGTPDLPIELVASRAKSGEVCLSVDLPGLNYHLTACPNGAAYSGTTDDDAPATPVVDNYSIDVPRLEGRTLLSGRLPARSSDIEVRAARRSGGSAEIRDLVKVVADPKPGLRERAGIAGRSVYFAVILPRSVMAGEIVARDAHGGVVDSSEFQLTDTQDSPGDLADAD